MSARRSLVCAGYMPLDIIRTSAGTVARRAGGTAANVAAILAFFAWHSILAGQTGDDPAGDELIADLHAAGVGTGQIRQAAGARTARLVHDVGPNGHAFRYRCPDCNSPFPRSRPLSLEGAATCTRAHPSPDVFVFDRANAATVALAERYEQAGSVVVFEPSMPANAELLARAAAVAHVIKHSDDRSVGGLEELRLTPRHGQLRIVTHGAEGLEIRSGTRRSRRLPALATLAVDTGGAGDWTTAGLLHRAVYKRNITLESAEEALRYGQALAAVNCATVGARGLMGLSLSAVRRRAREVLHHGGLTSEPRLAATPPPPAATSGCPSCLMPIDEQLSLPTEDASLSARRWRAPAPLQPPRTSS